MEREIQNTKSIVIKHYSAAKRARTQQQQQQQQQTEGGGDVGDDLACCLELQLRGAAPRAQTHPLILPPSVEVALQTPTDYITETGFLTSSVRLSRWGTPLASSAHRATSSCRRTSARLVAAPCGVPGSACPPNFCKRPPPPPPVQARRTTVCTVVFCFFLELPFFLFCNCNCCTVFRECVVLRRRARLRVGRSFVLRAVEAEK